MPKDTAQAPQKLPRHIAVIMDGNGRWAQQRGLPRNAGHKAGVEAARGIVTECRRLGIEYLTLYAFSQENWRRPLDEVSALFALLVDFLGQEVPNMERESIRLRMLGEIDALPLAARAAVRRALKRTAHCAAMTVNLALNYSGRGEILHAVRSLVRDGMKAEQISEEDFRQRLYTAGQPDPDLLIRTSGELRISNYLLFQCAYSELYFTEELWPDFSPESLYRALAGYAARQRRFGKTQEQLADT
ncbi:MAG: isoprenyl transferase [Desulfovibrionaceae bacterium]|nr:isoprenyl transferase [Desulfovibrionaceae bacterium]